MYNRPVSTRANFITVGAYGRKSQRRAAGGENGRSMVVDGMWSVRVCVVYEYV